MIPGMRKFKYPERLRKLKFPTLSYRRTSGDMIETYKLLSGVYDDQVSLQLNMNIAGEYCIRGNSRKLTVIRCKYNLRKYCFTNRIVNIWNSLPDDIILAQTVDQFKNRLDKYWKKKHDFIFDHRADP